MLNWQNICWSIGQNRPGEALEQVNEELARSVAGMLEECIRDGRGMLASQVKAI